MKYVKKLTVAGNEVKIVSESAVLDLAGPGRLTCRVERGGLLKSRKSLALLGQEVDSPTLTAEDRANLAQAGRFGEIGRAHV